MLLDSLPEEICEDVVRRLDYQDAFALKQVNRLFARLVDIPTLYTYAQCIPVTGLSRAECLDVLFDLRLIRYGYIGCRICHRFRRGTCYFSRNQYRALFPPWNRKVEPNLKALADSFCVTCGVKTGIYKPGDIIESDMAVERSYTGLVSYRNEELTICFSCLRIIGRLWDSCQSCRACEACCRLANVMSKSRLPHGLEPIRLPSSLDCFHREILGHWLDRNRQMVMPGRTISALNSLYRRIIGNLDYSSTLALRQTCHLLSRQHVLTVRSYIEHMRQEPFKPDSFFTNGLVLLRKEKIIPRKAQPCGYCKRFRLPEQSRAYYWRPLDTGTNYRAPWVRPNECGECHQLGGLGEKCDHELHGSYVPCAGCTCCHSCIERVEELLRAGTVQPDLVSAIAPKYLRISEGYCKHHATLRAYAGGPSYPSEYP